MSVDISLSGLVPKSEVLCGGKIWSVAYSLDENAKMGYYLLKLTPEGDADSVSPLVYPMDEDSVIPYTEGEYVRWRGSTLIDCGDDTPRLLMCLERISRTYDEQIESYRNSIMEKLEWNLAVLDTNGSVRQGISLNTKAQVDSGVSAYFARDGLLWMVETGYNEIDELASLRIFACSLTDGSIAFETDLPWGFFLSNLVPASDGRLLIVGSAGEWNETGDRITIGTRFYTLDPANPETAFTDYYNADSIPMLIPMRWEYDNIPDGETWLANELGIYTWDERCGELCLRYELMGSVAVSSDSVLLANMKDEYRLLSKKENEPILITSVGMNVTTRTDESADIIVAVVNNAELFEQVSLFNASQSEIAVQAIDYSDSAAAAAGFSSGTEMLQRALVQGEQIDIIAVPNDLSGGLMDSALFLDLYPLIDADGELSRDDFVSGVLTACENGDALPTVVPQYNLLTAVGSAAKLGDTPGWDWAQYDALTAGVPTPLYGFARDNVLHYMVQMGGKSLLDYDAAAAHLDTPRFAQLLTCAKAYPESTVTYNTQDPKPQFATGKSLAIIRFVGDFSHIRTDVYNFDGPIVHKGFPTDDGGTGSAFTAGLRLGISANCADADAAWQFLRQFLLPTYQDRLQTNFPLRRDSLQKRAEAAQQPLEYPSLPLYFNADALTEKQQEYWMRAITAEETQQLVDLIEATDTMFQFDAAVLNILGEESAAFFAGQTAAEAAAAIMQNRVQTYLDEQS